MSASRSDAVQEMRAAALKAAAKRGAAEVKAAREAKLAWEIANSHFVATAPLQIGQNITTKLTESKVLVNIPPYIYI